MITISGLKKSYQKPVLTDISLKVNQGEFVGIVGGNGCGKSTLLEIMAGALTADEGSIYYEGNSALENKRVFTQYVGYVPQENPLIEELSVFDNLKLWYSVGKRNLKKDMTEGPPFMLGLSELKNNTSGKLSGGMKKRLSIACALASEAPILLLDEPSAALDLICKFEIHSYLQYFVSKGGTVVMTTHEEAEMDLCEKLYIMRRGRLYETNSKIRGKELIAALKQ